MSDPVGPRPRAVEDDNAAVDRFSGDMMGKLRANAHKSHWSEVSQPWLLARMLQEVSELVTALESGRPIAIRSECADIANFAMMISENTR